MCRMQFWKEKHNSVCPAGLDQNTVKGAENSCTCPPIPMPSPHTSTIPFFLHSSRKSRNVAIPTWPECCILCVGWAVLRAAPQESCPRCWAAWNEWCWFVAVCPVREAGEHPWKCFCCSALGKPSSENCSAVLPGPATAPQGDFPADAFQGLDSNGSCRHLVGLKTRQIT